MKLARIQVKNDIQEGFIYNKWRKISSCWGTTVKMKEESKFYLFWEQIFNKKHLH